MHTQLRIPQIHSSRKSVTTVKGNRPQSKFRRQHRSNRTSAGRIVSNYETLEFNFACSSSNFIQQHHSRRVCCVSCIGIDLNLDNYARERGTLRTTPWLSFGLCLSSYFMAKLGWTACAMSAETRKLLLRLSSNAVCEGFRSLIAGSACRRDKTVGRKLESAP